MKIIKGLLYFIAGLFVLLCIFIVVCAFRPELSERVGGFLHPGNERGMMAETQGRFFQGRRVLPMIMKKKSSCMMR